MVATDPVTLDPRRFAFRQSRIVRSLVVIFAIVATAISGVCFLNPYLFDGRYHVDTLTIDAHRDIVITGAMNWEVSEPVYYEIRQDRHPLHDCHTLGFTHRGTRNLEFELIATDNRDFVAVVEKANPDIVLMFYDFRTGTNWPHDGPREALDADCCDSEPLDDYYGRMNQVLDRLRSSTHRTFVLSHQASGVRRIY